MLLLTTPAAVTTTQVGTIRKQSKMVLITDITHIVDKHPLDNTRNQTHMEQYVN
jgi:hypothetical protein